jgi:hypothetical protein
MRTYAKMPSGADPALRRGSGGRHAKSSRPHEQDFDHGRPLLAGIGRAAVIAEALRPPAGSPPAEETGGEPDQREPGLAPTAFPLPRRVAGQSGRVAYLASDPVHPLGVIPSLKVSGAPPWEPAPKPPGMP